MSVAIVSTIYDNYDAPYIPPEQDIECEWVMVTDRPRSCAPWRVVTEPRPHLPPRLAGKVPKTHSRHYTDADVVIWTDANVEVTAPDFASWCVAQLGDNPLKAYVDPGRATVHEEAAASAVSPRFHGQPCVDQADFYVKNGFPPDFGTWWTGLVIYGPNCPYFGDEWLSEITRWSLQDQIAIGYMFWQYGIDPKLVSIKPDWTRPDNGYGGWHGRDGVHDKFRMHNHRHDL